MKNKGIYSFLVFFCLLFTISSCSDDDDTNTDNLIIGKWQLVSSTDSDTESCLFSGHTDFKSNGKYEDHTGCGNKDGGGSWKMSGDELTMTANILPIPITATIKELTETTLILKLTLECFYTSTDTYKRVK